MGIKNRIYIVDDTENFLQTCKNALGSDFDIETFDLASDLVHQLESTTPPQVIVSNLKMPGILGMDLIRLLKKYDLEVPVILIAKGPSEKELEEAVSAGATQVLQKPVSMSELRESIDKALISNIETLDSASMGAEAIEITDLGQQILELYKTRALEAERLLHELGLLPSSVEAQLDRVLHLKKMERNFLKRKSRLIRIFNHEATVDDIVSTGRKPAA